MNGQNPGVPYFPGGPQVQQPIPAFQQPGPGYVPQQYAPPVPQPQQQPTPQPSQIQGTGRLNLRGDEILDGANVPPELRGRKVSDVMRIYSALADDFITRKRGQNPQQQQQGQPPQQQQPGPPQPQRQHPFYQQQNNQQQQETEEDKLRRIVGQVVGEAVQPFQQQTVQQQIQSSMQRARQTIPDFQELEPEIMEAIKGSSPEALANPAYWEHAADLARGRRLRQNAGHQQPQQPSIDSIFGPRAVPAAQPLPQPQPPAPQPMQNPYGIPSPQPTQQRPPTYQFFSEAPTAPSPYANTHSGYLTPAELQVAQLTGVTPDQYAAMKALQSGGRG